MLRIKTFGGLSLEWYRVRIEGTGARRAAPTARATWSALLEHWKDGDPDLPLLVTTRRELLRLEATGGR